MVRRGDSAVNLAVLTWRGAQGLGAANKGQDHGQIDS